jgi:hypothetical protein
MRLSFRLLVCIAVLLPSAGPALAEESRSEPTFRGGIGASLGIENLVLVDEGGLTNYPLGATGLYVPMIVSDKVKVEPEFGFYRYSSSYDGGYESSYNMFRFGLGIFYASFLGKETLVYLGIRGGILYNQRTYSSDYNPDTEERSKADFYIGPAVGAEHFLSDHFSLGAEVQFNYVHEGNWENGGYDDDRSTYYLSNNTHFFARFYFGAAAPVPPVDQSGPREPPAGPVKQETPAVPEESPAEIRHVQPPPAEPEKEPAPAPPAAPAVEIPACPEGAEPAGSAPPDGREQYCAKKDEGGNPIKHGWFRSWFDNSQIESEGEYRDGLRQGKWTFYGPEGEKTREAEYRDGAEVK